jgi:23S rRNA (cytidine1920-2'-O)/16S rRNA (cytidine1409-2'-O)-methyltransferase
MVGIQGWIIANLFPTIGNGIVSILAGKKDVARGDGVIRDPEIHKQVLLDVLGFAQREGFQIRGVIKSPLLGPKGNAEFLVWLGEGKDDVDVSTLVDRVLS